jgi:DNA uptake protein ComE-like DNA-binding protein
VQTCKRTSRGSGAATAGRKSDLLHNHPGLREPRSHGETHHEDRIVDLNTASEQDLADLPMVGPERRPRAGSG